MSLGDRASPEKLVSVADKWSRTGIFLDENVDMCEPSVQRRIIMAKILLMSLKDCVKKQQEFSQKVKKAEEAEARRRRLESCVSHYEELFCNDLQDVCGPKIELSTVSELLVQLEDVLGMLKEEIKAPLNRKQQLETEGTLLRLESDRWYLNELKNVLSRTCDGAASSLKHLYDVACNSPRYHYVIVKYLKNYPEAKKWTK